MTRLFVPVHGPALAAIAASAPRDLWPGARVLELLRMEPIERLPLNDRAVNAVLELREAFAARR